eukprot:CAMPEP_0171914840 /NCGR_PEP_ID=MMETSP0993-20121228/13248_1 /TAXON_ID=483369 /ORGANISM="non described non described, Strain CCMP2098" /LENGTH=66 /DNA_ID=CAMNT_0012549559 /DNA_START=342 /DNA_END=538 /DNA_ORIENTATION=+
MPAATRLVPFLCHVPKLAARAPLPAVLRARTPLSPRTSPSKAARGSALARQKKKKQQQQQQQKKKK